MPRAPDHWPVSCRLDHTSYSGAKKSTRADRVDAVSTKGNSFNLELQNSGTVAYAAVKAFN